jgi:hypothetical protein
MNNAKNFQKAWINSLSFLDNSMVQYIIIFVLVLYCSTIFDNINSFVGNLYNYAIIRLIVLFLIVYIAPKDTTIAILLGLSYLISLSYLVNNEYFSNSSTKNHKKHKESFVGDMYNGQKIDVMRSKMDESFANSQMNKGSLPTNTQNKNNRSKSTTKSTNKPQMNASTKEHFFPFQDQDVNNNQIPAVRHNVAQESNMMNEKSCLKTYVPMHESVSDVCSPVATFKNELNAQGLNYPEGFNHTVIGSPLS